MAFGLLFYSPLRKLSPVKRNLMNKFQADLRTEPFEGGGEK
jgi:hypothetical protein